MERRIASLAELDAFAAEFAGKLAPTDSGATLVTLSGELGAGKTAFTKALARVLGVEEVVNSPTFVLEKIYQLPKVRHPMSDFGEFARLMHIDAYRLESGKDLAPLGFDELMKDAGNLVALEWPERVADGLPEARRALTFVVNDADVRTISYDA